MRWIHALRDLLFLVFRSPRAYLRMVDPVRVSSCGDLEPILNRLLELGTERGELYLRSCEPRFLVRVRNARHKPEPNVLVVEIRNSDDNRQWYDRVRTALVTAQVSFRERFTPKTWQPKSLTVELGVDFAGGICASDSPPICWK
jgi:hypothetical protein